MDQIYRTVHRGMVVLIDLIYVTSCNITFLECAENICQGGHMLLDWNILHTCNRSTCDRSTFVHDGKAWVYISLGQHTSPPQKKEKERSMQKTHLQRLYSLCSKLLDTFDKNKNT
jgi:hypothetical protein